MNAPRRLSRLFHILLLAAICIAAELLSWFYRSGRQPGEAIALDAALSAGDLSPTTPAPATDKPKHGKKKTKNGKPLSRN